MACIEWIDPLMAAGNLDSGADRHGGRREPFRSRWRSRTAAPVGRPRLRGPRRPLGGALRLQPRADTAECSRRDSRASPDGPRCARSGRDASFLGDGNAFFNRPGPRVVETLECLAEALHPEAFHFRASLTPAGSVPDAELRNTGRSRGSWTSSFASHGPRARRGRGLRQVRQCWRVSTRSRARRRHRRRIRRDSRSTITSTSAISTDIDRLLPADAPRYDLALLHRRDRALREGRGAGSSSTRSRAARVRCSWRHRGASGRRIFRGPIPFETTIAPGGCRGIPQPYRVHSDARLPGPLHAPPEAPAALANPGAREPARATAPHDSRLAWALARDRLRAKCNATGPTSIWGVKGAER